MDRSWRVVFHGPVSDQALAALPSPQMLYVSGHNLPGQQSSTIWVRAPDAAAAEDAVSQAISAPGAVEPAAPLPYWISIGVPEEDVEALERALSKRRTESGSIDSLITKEPTDGFAELMLEVFAETDEGAVRGGLEAYRDLRIAAGLSPADPPYFSLQPPWRGRQPQLRHRVLFERAQHLLEHRERDLAVVVAQTACEVLIAQVINERLEAREIGALRPHITSHIRTYALTDDRTRQLWQELTSDAITQPADTWRQYREHVARRNAVVHQGADVSDREASASLVAVEGMLEHIEGLSR